MMRVPLSFKISATFMTFSSLVAGGLGMGAGARVPAWATD